MTRKRMTDWDWKYKPLQQQVARPVLFLVAVFAYFMRLDMLMAMSALAIFLPWEIRPPIVYSLLGGLAWIIALFSSLAFRNHGFGIFMFLIGLYFWVDEWKTCYKFPGDGPWRGPSESDVNTSHIVEELRDD